ncbi:MAG: ABC transporter permease [Alphaproteobacteria bacterium]
MRLALDIALAHLTGRPRQSAAAISGIALGAALFVVIAGLLEGFQHYFVAKMVDVAPHIVVKDEQRRPPPQPIFLADASALAVLHGVRPREFVRGIKNVGATLAWLESQPGLTATPVMHVPAFLRYGAMLDAVTLIGIDAASYGRVIALDPDLQSGRLRDLEAVANGVIVGEGIARRLGVARGADVSARSASGIETTLRVVGVFRTGIAHLDDSEGYVPIRRAEALDGRANVVNQIRIRLDAVDRAVEVARRIEQVSGFRSEPWQETHGNVLALFSVFNVVAFTALSALFAVSGAGVYSIVSTVVLEKARDIAILRALGFRPAFVEVMFLAQGVAMGVVGAGLGCAIGLVASEALSAIPLDLHGPVVRTENLLVFDWSGYYAIAAAAAIATACLGALLPARRAARLDPVVVLRGAEG